MNKALMAVLLFAGHIAASPVPDFPFVAVSGSATKKVSPDEASIEFTVLCHDPSSEVAVATVNKRLTNVVEGIVGLGVSKEAITADDLSKQAVREKGEDYKLLKILGYDVSREVKVTISEVERYTAVLRLIMATDNVTAVSSKFDTKSREQIEAALMASACADAKRKAELMSRGVGVALGDVFAVSNQAFSDLSDSFGFGFSGYARGGLPSPSGSEEIPVFVPAKIELLATVNVLYRLGSAQKSEQGGAVQPTNAPESKSGDKNKPQSESPPTPR